MIHGNVLSVYLKECMGVSTEKQYPMTVAGKQKLQDELTHLITVKRKEVVERIKIARSFGDLSENSEYDSAKRRPSLCRG